MITRVLQTSSLKLQTRVLAGAAGRRLFRHSARPAIRALAGSRPLGVTATGPQAWAPASFHTSATLFDKDKGGDEGGKNSFDGMSLAEAISMQGKQLEDIVAGTDEAEEVLAELNKEATEMYRDGNYKDAAILAEQSLKIAWKHFGPEHPASASAANNAAVLKKMLGEYRDAQKLYRDAVQCYTKLLGEEHKSTQVAMHNLAACLKLTKHYEEAEEIVKKLMEIRKKTDGPASSQYAISLQSLANLYDLQDKPDLAWPYYEQALGVLEGMTGVDERLFYATSLNNMGLFKKNNGKFEDARSYYEKALLVREEILGKEHPEYANILHNLIQLFKIAGWGEEEGSLDHELLADWKDDLDHFKLM